MYVARRMEPSEISKHIAHVNFGNINGLLLYEIHKWKQLHDLHREPTNLCNWGKEALKTSGLQRDSNRDLR